MRCRRPGADRLFKLYLAVFDPEQFGGGAATWPMFAASLCLTVAFAISITRYRLMQVDQLLSSGVIYFLLSFLAGLVYYGLAFLGLFLVNSQGGDGPSLVQVLIVSSIILVLLVAARPDARPGQVGRWTAITAGRNTSWTAPGGG